MSQVVHLCEHLSAATGHEASAFEPLLRRALPRLVETDADVVDALIAAIDADVAAQLGRVLAHPKLRRLEATWRGLHHVLARAPRDAGLRFEIVNCSLPDLEADFEDAPRIVQSGLFKLVYSAEYGPFGGRPYAAVLCHDPFEPEDLPLLRKCAEVAHLAALQFVGQAGAKLLDMALADEPRTGPATWDAPSRWAAFREREDARFVSLVAGRWLARAPVRQDPTAERPWPFVERDDALRWSSGAPLLALSLARSFVTFRTPLHAFGEDGRVTGLPRHGDQSACGAAPAERAGRLDSLGFLPLVQRAPGEVELAGDATCADRPHRGGRYLDEPGRTQHVRLPVTLCMQRFVQYFKVLHREQVGTWRTREETESALCEWLQAYAGDSPTRLVRGFTLRVEDVPSHLGIWSLDLQLELDRWAGGVCEATIEGRLDRE